MKTFYKTPAIVLFVIISASLPAQDSESMIGQKAPGFTLTDINGKSYSLENSKGKFVVIHIAATWCPFCNAEAPNLELLYRDFREKGVDVFIIDVREDKELVSKAFSRFNFSFPVLLDLDGSVSASYAPKGVQPALERYEVPIASNLILDKEGKIMFYSLLNTLAFDAKLTTLREKLVALIETSH
jgi:peroxiredoxin